MRGNEISRLNVIAANLTWLLYCAAKTRRWRRAARDPAQAQGRALDRIIRQNSDTAFGHEHGFDLIHSIPEFQNRVTIRSYEDFLPYIDRIAHGEKRVLTTQDVTGFAVTSGSVSASKLIPCTPGLMEEFQEGIHPWAFHLFRQYPALLTGVSYWSITPVGDSATHTAAGIPIGFDDESAYLSPLTRQVMETMMPFPGELARIRDMDTFRYTTLLFLLRQEKLSWISIWNPTFWTLLLEPLAAWQDSLLADLESGTLTHSGQLESAVLSALSSSLKPSPQRARSLRAILREWQGQAACARDRSGRTLYERIWPALRLISCWAHGSAQNVIPLLRERFPNIVIQPKGLLATEAFISFPFRGEASALSLCSHFFEFEELGETRSDIRLAHEIEQGKKYSVIATTSGGLYRYRLNDIVEVIGTTDACPLIRFVGKQDKVSDIRGEKLNEQFIRSCVEMLLKASNLQPVFWMLAPRQTREHAAGYILFVQFPPEVTFRDTELDTFRAGLDEALRTSYHYDYCRRLGQLDSCSLFLITASVSAASVYLNTCSRLGQRQGDIKPAMLHSFDQWEEAFPGRRL